MRSRFLVFLILLIPGCAGIPDGVEAVKNFDAERYMGKWYEIARLENRFEEGLTRVTAFYRLRDDGGIDVINRGYDWREKTWEQAEGRGYFVGDRDVGQLKVTFFWPFYSGYNVIRLDHENYLYALVCGSDRSYLWILARKPFLERGVIEELVDYATSRGFDTGELLFIEHGPPGE